MKLFWLTIIVVGIPLNFNALKIFISLSKKWSKFEAPLLDKNLIWSLISFLSIDIVKTSILYFLILDFNKLKSGSSSLHGTHQVAQKLIT